MFLQLRSGSKRKKTKATKAGKKECNAGRIYQHRQLFQNRIPAACVHFGVQKPERFFEMREIEFQQRSNPAFNRQFDLLMKDLKSWEAKGFTLNLFAENPKQLERLYTIFKDLKEEITFNPIATSIHEGFIDEDLKIVCYTDHQIFQRYHKYKVKQAYNKNKALTLRPCANCSPAILSRISIMAWACTAACKK
jgi:transcription-repair coupling factor (superfamily II helicase)